MSKNLPVTGNTEYTRPENRVFYPALDGLRAIAFVMVFFWHYCELPWGWAGVDIFFVLSGFLITGILFDTRDDLHRVRNFYVRRTLRIFPLYYGIFVALLLTWPFLHWQWNWHWLVWPAYLGNLVPFFHPYVSGGATQRLGDFVVVAGHEVSYAPLFMGHFWTLCVEEQFYLVWPWVVFWVRDRRKLIWICAASIPICLAERMLAGHVLPAWMIQNEVVAHTTPFRVDDLLLGGLMALLLRGPNREALLRWARPIAAAAFSCLILWFVFTPAGNFLADDYHYPASMLTFGLTSIAFLAGLAILVAVQPKSWVSRVLSLYPLRWLGRISYGAYVFHDMFHTFYFNLWRRVAGHLIRHHYPFSGSLVGRVTWGTAFIGFCGTLLLASVSFKFYESRFLNLKERWTIR